MKNVLSYKRKSKQQLQSELRRRSERLLVMEFVAEKRSVCFQVLCWMGLILLPISYLHLFIYYKSNDTLDFYLFLFFVEEDEPTLNIFK